MNDPEEKRLRDLLHQLGCEAEGRAPDFARLWKSARKAQNTGASSAWRASVKWAFAAALIVMAGLAAVVMTHRPDKSIASTLRGDHAVKVVALGADEFDEEAPTDFLLAENDDAAPPLEHLAREIDALLRP